MTEPFDQLLQRLRARAGLTVTELAEALGASRMSIRTWEKGTRVPRDRARLDDLAQVLKLSSAEADQMAAAARSHRLLPEVAALPVAGAEAADFAPTSGTPQELTARHQLRAPLADFVGRVREIEQLRVALQAERASAIICGVCGMGGIGKTELAYGVAHELRPDFPDGQLVLTLSGSSLTPLAPEQALQAIIRAFRPEAKLPENLRELELLYRSILHEKRALILADDAGDASQVRALLPPTGCALLITSRTRFTLPGMLTIDLEQLTELEAVALLHSICPRLDADEAQAITRACGRLPLALRVSGSILHNNPALDVAAYVQQLNDEWQRLSQLRDPDDPQLDVAASLALSYTQLDVVAQQVFRQLGVLVSNFATPLAVAVVEEDAGVDVEVVLRQLLRRNLLMYDTERGRWRLHDLVRDLARCQLEVQGEVEATSWRYARAAMQLAREADERYQAGGESMLAGLALFDQERLHIDAGWGWARERASNQDADALLLDYAEATLFVGNLRYDMRRERIPQLEAQLAAARRLIHRRGEDTALGGMGHAYYRLGDFRQAISCYEQALAIARELGDHWGEGFILRNLGNAYTDLGETERALESCAEGLSIARANGDRQGEGYALSYLARSLVLQGELARATTALEQALALLREVGDRWGEAECSWLVGLAFARQGEREQALPLLRVAVAYEQAIGDTKAAAHTALLARLEGGESLPSEQHPPTGQRALGDDKQPSTYDNY